VRSSHVTAGMPAEKAGPTEAGLKKWRPDYGKVAPWKPPAPRPPSRCTWRRAALGCFGLAAGMLAVGTLAGWFDRDDAPSPAPAPAPMPPPVPGAPRAAVAPTQLPGVVAVSWGAVDGAVGYLLQEWNWNRLDDRGWYSQRALEGDDGEFMFRFGHGGIELPRCGTVVAVPHASLQVAGRAGLRLEWRVRSVGPTGVMSAWSDASNAVDMPRWQGEVLRNNCEQCSAGNHDHDSNPETLCKPCSPGTFAALGSLDCSACAPGLADLDLDSSTLCEPCPRGSFAQATACEVCALGYSDHDNSSATECTRCPAGSHSPRNATSCTECPTGLRDWDDDPSTACTACPTCAPGECPVGTHARRIIDAASTTTVACTPCRGELVDHDEDPLTECQVCSPGTESSVAPYGAVSCSLCAAGKTDRDLNASTACSTCSPGSYSDAGSFGNCSVCAAGRSSDSGATSADACYRVGIAPGLIIILLGLAAAIGLAVAAVMMIWCARATLAAKSSAQSWWTHQIGHRMKVQNYEAGGDTTPAVVPKPSSWLQDTLLLMKRVDSTVHQASITEDIPQYPRPSAAPIRNVSQVADRGGGGNGGGGGGGGGENQEIDAPDNARNKKIVTRALTRWEAQYSGAVTGKARASVALAVAAKREKKAGLRQDDETVARDLRDEGRLSYTGYKPTLPKLSDAQHNTRVFKSALHASRAAADWRPSPRPQAAASNAQQSYLARPRPAKSNHPLQLQLPPLRSRFAALERAIELESGAKLDRLDEQNRAPVNSDPILAANCSEWLYSIGLEHWEPRLAQIGTTLEDFCQLERRELAILGFPEVELRHFVSALERAELAL
jgi:hypothetical protein